MMGLVIIKPKMPPLTKCPQCFNADRTVVCRYCKVDKIKPTVTKAPISLTVVPAEYGSVRVRFQGKLNDQPLDVDTVIAPADPHSGLIYPYPLTMQAFDQQGERVALNYAAARDLASQVSGQLF